MVAIGAAATEASRLNVIQMRMKWNLWGPMNPPLAVSKGVLDASDGTNDTLYSTVRLYLVLSVIDDIRIVTELDLSAFRCHF